jgi:hypothetical protein
MGFSYRSTFIANFALISNRPKEEHHSGDFPINLYSIYEDTKNR